MRISFSFGGGPHRGRGTRSGKKYYRHVSSRASLSIPLGPVGNLIASVIFIAVGIFSAFIGFNSVAFIVGLIIIVVGIVSFRSSYLELKNKRNKDIEEE